MTRVYKGKKRIKGHPERPRKIRLFSFSGFNIATMEMM